MRIISIPDHLYSVLSEMSELNCISVQKLATYFILVGGKSLGHFEIGPDDEGGDQE